MPSINLKSAAQYLEQQDYTKLFINELGWSYPNSQKTQTIQVAEITVELRPVAQLEGVTVFVAPPKNKKFGSGERKTVHNKLERLCAEHLIIFQSPDSSDACWSWLKRHGRQLREQWYFSGANPASLLSRLRQMYFDLDDFDKHGHTKLSEVVDRLENAFDIETVTKKFFEKFQTVRTQFVELIRGLPDEHAQKWYASILLNRMMFIYFMQKKGFINYRETQGGNTEYLSDKFTDHRNNPNSDSFFRQFLVKLFFRGFAQPEKQRTVAEQKLLGSIPYLSGSLFALHKLEQDGKIDGIFVPNEAFENLLDLFDSYTWALNDQASRQSKDEINPDVLGYIFEKYINQKQMGAYYTPPEITEYLSKKTIGAVLAQKLNKTFKTKAFKSWDGIFRLLDANAAKALLTAPEPILPKLSLLDPACGSGAFLVAALKLLTDLYGVIAKRIPDWNDPELNQWLQKTVGNRAPEYAFKKLIITQNLYGVDIMDEAVEIARLRLFLSMCSSVNKVAEIEPLPNIDFNIMPGNSLIGLLHVTDAEINLFANIASYKNAVDNKNRAISQYRLIASETTPEDAVTLRRQIEHQLEPQREHLNELLLHKFGEMKISCKEVIGRVPSGKGEGKPVFQNRPVLIEDIRALNPFHWGFEFDEVMDHRGGFDAVITNPPWENLKPDDKEFFMKHSDEVSKNKLNKKEFDRLQKELLKDEAVLKEWKAYYSSFPHQSEYFRQCTQYPNQISTIDGKKQGTDINLYKLFTEQCFNLLAPNGLCGIVIPGGIYSDLGAKQLRTMLFDRTRITGLFGFENREKIFEGVDSRFKFVVLTFASSSKTAEFPAAFMRHNVEDLLQFPSEDDLMLDVDDIKRLSPDAWSIMELKSHIDMDITAKAARLFPMLGQELSGPWNLKLNCEFHMTNDSDLFHEESTTDRWPLYEGKMMHRYNHRFADVGKYFLNPAEARRRILGQKPDVGQTLSCMRHRLGFRDVASNTNERTAICTMLPKNVFLNHKLPEALVYTGTMPADKKPETNYRYSLALEAVWNSFVFDFLIRLKVNTNLTFTVVNSTPCPRLSEADAEFEPLVRAAARLTCVTDEFADVAEEAGITMAQAAVSPKERAALMADIDGRVAHLYRLTRAEFEHVLSTFPAVAAAEKQDALAAYDALACEKR